MKAKDLLKKYPEYWATVEAAVWDDLLFAIPNVESKTRKRIAYNAAFSATYEHNKKGGN